MSKSGGLARYRLMKTLKVQIEFHGVNIRNTKQIGHNAIGATSTTYIIKSSAACFGNNVPINQKIGNEPHFFDEL